MRINFFEQIRVTFWFYFENYLVLLRQYLYEKFKKFSKYLKLLSIVHNSTSTVYFLRDTLFTSYWEILVLVCSADDND